MDNTTTGAASQQFIQLYNTLVAYSNDSER